MTAYSLLPKSTYSMSIQSPLQAENSTFLASAETRDIAQNSPKHAISSKQFNFLSTFHSSLAPTKPPGLLVDSISSIGFP